MILKIHWVTSCFIETLHNCVYLLVLMVLLYSNATGHIHSWSCQSHVLCQLWGLSCHHLQGDQRWCPEHWSSCCCCTSVMYLQSVISGTCPPVIDAPTYSPAWLLPHWHAYANTCQFSHQFTHTLCHILAFSCKQATFIFTNTDTD